MFKLLVKPPSVIAQTQALPSTIHISMPFAWWTSLPWQPKRRAMSKPRSNHVHVETATWMELSGFSTAFEPWIGKTEILLNRALSFGVWKSRLRVIEAQQEATGIRYPTLSNHIQVHVSRWNITTLETHQSYLAQAKIQIQLLPLARPAFLSLQQSMEASVARQVNISSFKGPTCWYCEGVGNPVAQIIQLQISNDIVLIVMYVILALLSFCILFSHVLSIVVLLLSHLIGSGLMLSSGASERSPAMVERGSVDAGSVKRNWRLLPMLWASNVANVDIWFWYIFWLMKYSCSVSIYLTLMDVMLVSHCFNFFCGEMPQNHNLRT